MIKTRKEKRKIRHLRIRKKVKGKKDRPRLFVFESLKHIYCQLIDDEKGKTILAASDFEIKEKKKNKIEMAKEVGKLIAKKAKEKGIEKVVFDRGGYKYHGKIKALADGAREGGLKF